MSFADLPPELLLEVFSRTVPESPSLERQEYLKRTRTLVAFSLVHPRWTRLAQELLLREVWIGVTRYREGEVERQGRQLVQVRGDRTKYLTVEGDINALLEQTGLERWKGLVYLKNRPKYGHRADFDTFALFPNLETLHIDHGIVFFKKFDLDLSFTKLRRLVFSDRPDFEGDIEDIQTILSPVYLPNLAHLAIASPEHASFGQAQLFASILPQVTTLALYDVIYNHSDADLFQIIGRCSRLRHLALDVKSADFEYRLFWDAAGLELDSLHIPSLSVVDSFDLPSRLTAVVKGEPETIKVKRVVLYDEKNDYSASQRYQIDNDVFREWGKDRDAPPFEDFDGR